MHSQLGIPDRQLGAYFFSPIYTLSMRTSSSSATPPPRSPALARNHAAADFISLLAACGEFIEALEACHAQGILYKWSGACNDHKWALSHCLTKEVSALGLRIPDS